MALAAPCPEDTRPSPWRKAGPSSMFRGLWGPSKELPGLSWQTDAAPERQHAVVRPRQFDRLDPCKPSTGGGLKNWKFQACCQESQPSAGAHKGRGGLDGLCHVVHGAQSHAIRLLAERLPPPGMDSSVKLQDAERLLQERRLLALRLGERDRKLWPTEGNGDSGEAGAGAKVKKTRNTSRQRLGAGDGFDKVAGENAFLITNGGQVDAGVPAKKKRTVPGEAEAEGGLQLR